MRKKSYSSLSALPSVSSKSQKNKNRKSRLHKKTETNLNKKSIQKTPNDEQKDQEYVDQEYDSCDSLDQLNDESFIPNKSKPDHMKKTNNTTPRKNVKLSAGGKRAKAMALMASTAKKPNKRKQNGFRDLKQIHESNKKQYNSIRKQLKPTIPRNIEYEYNDRDKDINKYITPSIKSRTRSNFTSLRKSRKVISPTPMINKVPPSSSASDHNDNNLMVTPTKLSAFKALSTPCTPTPVKLMRSLNVKTPITKSSKSKIHDHEIKTIDNKNKLKSWKDIEYTPGQKQHKNQDINHRDTNVNKKGNGFESLLKATRVLPLPLKWKILMDKFNALESTLSLYQRKNSFFVHYQNIESSVQTICKKRFSKQDLQQILTIVPDFYHIQWTANYDKLSHKKELKLTLTAMDYDPYNDQQIEQPFHKDASCDDSENDENDKDKDEDEDRFVVKKKNGDINKDHEKEKENDKLREIGIRFLKVFKMKEREKVFRLRLIQYVSYHHNQWLIDNILIQFDPFVTGQWHKRFDLENIKDIELSPLPLKPRKNMDEIEKMVKEQEKKLDDIIQNEMERIKKEKEAKVQEIKKGDKMLIPDHLKHLSPTLIAKIRAKKHSKITLGKSLTSNKGKNDNGDDNEQYRLQQLPYLVNLMRGIYVSLRKNSMSCNDLINLIKKRHRNHHLLNEEIWKQLQLLNGLQSKFFKIKKGPMVKVAKLNKRIATKEVLDEIQRKMQ